MQMASRPDLMGLKPGLIKKMKKKQAFLKNIGAMDASGKLVQVSQGSHSL
jgi:hypothetical protein